MGSRLTLPARVEAYTEFHHLAAYRGEPCHHVEIWGEYLTSRQRYLPQDLERVIRDKAERTCGLMKIYVASSFANVAEARRVMKLLRSIGHAIAYDWPSFAPIRELSPADADIIAPLRASEEMVAVSECDLLILLLAPEMRGSWCELGGALLAGKRVFVVRDGPRVPTDCNFVYHPRVEWFSNVEQAIASI